MKVRRGLLSLVFCGYVSWAVPVRADAVLDWNAITAQAILNAGAARPSASPFLDLAMVQIAIHDAVQAYQKRFEPYSLSITGASGSPVAAVAKAAHDVLVNRFVAQSVALDAAYHGYLIDRGLSEADPGVFVGQQAAAAIINLRQGDGSFPATFPPFTGGTVPGMWRPTLPLFAPMAAPWLGAVTPFALKDSTQLRPEPLPPALTSGEYTLAYNEVKALGALVGSTRTQDQTDLALFWASNYLVLWSRTMRAIAAAHVTDIGDTARLFALASVAAADAAITAWDGKKFYAFWRPITGIQEGNTDGNPRTIGDPGWRPLIDTPPYPDYTSGANNVTSAITRTLALFFGSDLMTFSVTSTLTNTTRMYSRFSVAEDEVMIARIYEGIHFRFADTVARRQGKRAADWAFSHVMRPVQD